MLVDPLKKILYADDDTDDKAWVSEACKAVNSTLHIDFVENGREALDYLAHLPKKQLPSLIVLDLNMPELDGRQTLQRLKSNTDYQDIPVVIVTTSSSKLDRDICSRLGASLYLTKPDRHMDWQHIIRQLEPFIN